MRRIDREELARTSAILLDEMRPFLNEVRLSGWTVRVIEPVAYWAPLRITISLMSHRYHRSILIVRDPYGELELRRGTGGGLFGEPFKATVEEAESVVKRWLQELSL